MQNVPARCRLRHGLKDFQQSSVTERAVAYSSRPVENQQAIVNMAAKGHICDPGAERMKSMFRKMTDRIRSFGIFQVQVQLFVTTASTCSSWHSAHNTQLGAVLLSKM